MKRIAAIALAIVMVVSFVGCDSASPLEKYVNSSEFQQELQDAMSSSGMAGIDLKVTAKGETLTYIYTYQEQLDNSDNLYTDLLNSAIDAQASTFTSLAAQLKSELDLKDPEVVLVYNNADGSTLATRTFHMG